MMFCIPRVLRRLSAIRILAASAGLVIALGGVLAVAGCSGSKKADTAVAAAKPKTYPIHGEIISVDAAKNVIVLQHGAVAGYMPAMTMEFRMSPGDIANAKAGQHIRATLHPSDTDMPALTEVWPDDRVDKDILNQGQKQLREDTFDRGQGAYRELGEKIPNFALCNQDGQVVTADRFRGKMVMLNFIYTRCPVATMCPLETSKMIATQKLAKERGVKNIEFVSVTMDPTYDTPGVLKEYAKVRNIDTGNFSFLTGPEPAVRDLLTQFGIIAQFKGGILRHTLATLLIDPSGRIAFRADGSVWSPEDFVSRMKS